MTWGYEQDLIVKALEKKIKQPPTPREIAPQVLLPGSLLIWATYDDGTIVRYIVSRDDEKTGIKKYLDFFFSPTKAIPIQGKPDRFGRQPVKTVRRKSINVYDHEGIHYGFKAIDALTKANEALITFKMILKAWGIKDKEDQIANARVLANLKPGTTQIEVIRPPNEERFLALMSKWYDEKTPTEIKTFYHGTYAHNIPSILLSGLECRDGRATKLGGGCAFGAGIYLGHTNKAQNYAFPGSKHDEGDGPKFKFLLEIDVMLGKIYETKEILRGKAPGLVREAGCHALSFCGFARPEWVCYNPDQVMVKKIIRIS